MGKFSVEAWSPAFMLHQMDVGYHPPRMDFSPPSHAVVPLILCSKQNHLSFPDGLGYYFCCNISNTGWHRALQQALAVTAAAVVWASEAPSTRINTTDVVWSSSLTP